MDICKPNQFKQKPSEAWIIPGKTELQSGTEKKVEKCDH